MADPTPTLDATTRATLQKLADITTPAPVSWVPQTWGWAVVAAVVLATALWFAVRLRKRQLANRYRREALAELTLLEARLADSAHRASALAAIPPLLKRVALAAWPRPEVASLSGEAWVAFLRRHAGRTAFPDPAAHLLADEYRALLPAETMSEVEARAFSTAVRRWIVEHHVPA